MDKRDFDDALGDSREHLREHLEVSFIRDDHYSHGAIQYEAAQLNLALGGFDEIQDEFVSW